jgi:hypothetical protein
MHTVRNWIKHSRSSDKERNRFDIVNFIDKDFCRLLIQEYPRCYYNDCNVELQYRNHNGTLATIERLNNNIGHIKTNCVLACLKCNLANRPQYYNVSYYHFCEYCGLKIVRDYIKRHSQTKKHTDNIQYFYNGFRDYLNS